MLWRKFLFAIIERALRFRADAKLIIEDRGGSVDSEISVADIRKLRPSNRVAELTSASTLTADQSGMTFFLNAAGGFATALPAPAEGLEYTFFVKTAPATGNYTIVTNGGADIICGGINELEVDTGDDGPYLADADTVTFVSSLAEAGDFVHLISDGTKWYLHGQTNKDGGATLTKS